PKVGVSHARNLGMAVAAHDVLVFADDDVLATHEWFGTLVDGLIETGTRSVVTGQVRATEPTRSGNFAPSTKVEQSRAVYVGRVGRDVLFSNMAMHRCVYEEIGNFDERLGPGSAYPGAEDNDLGFRMLEAGYR